MRIDLEQFLAVLPYKTLTSIIKEKNQQNIVWMIETVLLRKVTFDKVLLDGKHQVPKQQPKG